MAEKKKKNKPAVTKKMHTQEAAEYSLATSPRFKTIAAKVDKGELTTAEALDMLVPKNLKGEERKKARMKLAGVLGTQTAKQFMANSRQEVSEAVNRPGGDYEKKQTRKPAMAKGGMVKGYAKGGYANCGASMKATQKSTMACGGMAKKKK